MSLIPNSYHELLAHAANYSNLSKPQMVEVIKGLGLHGLALHAQAPIFYVVDYSQRKYLYIDPTCEKLLGYQVDFMAEAGPMYFTGLWNRNDFKCFNEKIFPEAMEFLKNQSVSDYPDFSFSYNYRVQAKDGNYLTVLQRSTYLAATDDGKPLAAVGYIIDITSFKTDSSMVHTIERVDRNFTTLSKEPLFKSVHYPDKVDSILSKRELEILGAVNDGLCSKEIANKFFLSLNTINNHRKNMLEKTKTGNSTELIRYARQHGLI
jgi:DNA-binding CsgD family transcriptional regulator